MGIVSSWLSSKEKEEDSDDPDDHDPLKCIVSLVTLEGVVSLIPADRRRKHTTYLDLFLGYHSVVDHQDIWVNDVHNNICRQVMNVKAVIPKRLWRNSKTCIELRVNNPNALNRVYNQRTLCTNRAGEMSCSCSTPTSRHILIPSACFPPIVPPVVDAWVCSNCLLLRSVSEPPLFDCLLPFVPTVGHTLCGRFCNECVTFERERFRTHRFTPILLPFVTIRPLVSIVICYM